MSGTTIGKAWVEILPSTREFPNQLKSMIEGPADSAGSSAGSKIAGALKKAIAAAGIGTALKKSLDLGAELQQNLGGTEAVFGKYADSLQSKAKEAYMNMGLSASDYMATANKMGSLFQGSGVEQVRALELTQDAMQRAADVASVMGIDTSMAMESIAGAAKGNFTMMDNLGVAMNATTLQAYALEKGVNFDWNTASNAEKAELAMKMFMDRTSQYQGNFARESEETLSGSIGAMKAAAQDFMANLTLGTDVSASMKNLVTTAVSALSNLIPAVGNIFRGLPGAIKTAITQIHPVLLSGFKSATDAIKTAITQIHPVLLSGFKSATDAIKQNLPTMLQDALHNLLNFSDMLLENAGELVDAGLEMVKSIADGIIQSIPTIIETVPTIISNFANIINQNAPKIIKTGLTIIKALAKGLIQAIPVLIANIPKILTAIWDVFTAFQWINLGKTVIKKLGDGIKGSVSSIKSHFKDLTSNAKETIVSGFEALKGKVSSIWNSIKTAITNPIEAAKTAVSNAISKIKSLLSGTLSFPHVKLPHFSISGKFSLNPPSIPKIGVSWYRKAEDNPYLFTNPTLFGAGEGKDEVMYGKAALMRDMTKAVEKADRRGGATFNNYFTINNADNPEAVAQAITTQLRLQMRSA